MISSNLKPTDKSNHPTASAVSFKEFAALARRRSWTVQSLAERFRGRIDNPTEFFTRVLSGKFFDNLIPYRSVIEFYFASQTIEPSGAFYRQTRGARELDGTIHPTLSRKCAK